MTETGHCPNCGALVAPDAKWCGQCYTPLGAAAADPGPDYPELMSDEEVLESLEPAPETGTGTVWAPRETGVQTASMPIRKVGEKLLWDCKMCGQANAMEAPVCIRCGTPFAQLLAEEESAARVLPSPGTALGLSLFIVGLGHMVMGRAADGIARLILFLWALGLGVIMLLAPEKSGPVIGVGALFLLTALSLWAVTGLEAFRYAGGDEEPLLRPRILLFGTIALTMLSIGGIVAAGFSANAAGAPAGP